MLQKSPFHLSRWASLIRLVCLSSRSPYGFVAFSCLRQHKKGRNTVPTNQNKINLWIETHNLVHTHYCSCSTCTLCLPKSTLHAIQHIIKTTSYIDVNRHILPILWQFSVCCDCLRTHYLSLNRHLIIHNALYILVQKNTKSN